MAQSMEGSGTHPKPLWNPGFYSERNFLAICTCRKGPESCAYPTLFRLGYLVQIWFVTGSGLSNLRPQPPKCLADRCVHHPVALSFHLSLPLLALGECAGLEHSESHQPNRTLSPGNCGAGPHRVAPQDSPGRVAQPQAFLCLRQRVELVRCGGGGCWLLEGRH